MTARPWGTTGRVAVDRCDCLADGTGDGVHVFVDGQMVGGVDGDPPHRTYLHGRAILRGVETIDQGVMAILRRADADVWRQERGPVCWVRWHPEAKPRPWHLTLPGGSRPAATYGHHSWAMTDGRAVATNLASQATRDLS